MEDKQKLFRLIKSINSDKRASKAAPVERASPARDPYGRAWLGLRRGRGFLPSGGPVAAQQRLLTPALPSAEITPEALLAEDNTDLLDLNGMDDLLSEVSPLLCRSFGTLV